MPVIKARTNRVTSVRHISRLQEPNRDTLILYARFIGDTPDYVLNQVIEHTLGKDRDFLTWRADQPPLPPRARIAGATALPESDGQAASATTQAANHEPLRPEHSR